MVNLLADTLLALNYYAKSEDDIIGVVYYNEDINKLEMLSWSDFTMMASTINYDPNDFEFIGIRAFKPRLFIVSDSWFLARSLRHDKFEGWVYYDEPLEINKPLDITAPSDDLIAFMIPDLSHHHSDYVADYNWETNAFPGEYSNVPDIEGVPQVNIIHGIGGRVYWTDNLETGKHPQLLWNPTIVNMVIAGEHKNPDVFNNQNLSQMIGVEDARYSEHGLGDLKVTTIPVQHFTIYQAKSGDEVIQLTEPAPYRL